MPEKRYSIIGFTLFVIVILGLLMGVYFFGMTGIFKLLGVHYQSIWSLVVFTVLFYILGLVIDLVFEPMGDLTAEKVTGSISKFVIRLLFGFAANWIALIATDAFMGSITLTLETKLIVAIVIAVLETVVSDEETANQSRNK